MNNIFLNSKYNNIIDNIIKKENSTIDSFVKRSLFLFLYYLLTLLSFLQFKTYNNKQDKNSKIAFDLMSDKTTYSVYQDIAYNLNKDFIILALNKKYLQDKFTKKTKKEFKDKIFYFDIVVFFKSFLTLNLKEIIFCIDSSYFHKIAKFKKGKIYFMMLYWQFIVNKNNFSTFITFNDTSAPPIRHLVFNANNIVMIHIQNGDRDIRDSPTFNSYDYLCTFGSKVIEEYYKDDLKSHIKTPIVYGSFLLNKILKRETAQSIDICFVEQLSPLIKTNSFIQNDYIKAIDNLKEYSNGYNFNILYAIRENIRESPTIEYSKFIRKIDNILSTSNIKISNNNIYDDISQSKLVITYNSTVGLEAIGLGKKVLFCNYSKFNFGILKSNETFYSIIDSDYNIFKNKVNEILNSKDFLNKIKTLQYQYMYPNKDYLKVLEDIIKP